MYSKDGRRRSQLIGLALVCAFGTVNAEAQAPGKPKLPVGDPCTVVPLADVQKAFPGAQAGVRRRDVEQFGMTQCIWSHMRRYELFGVEERYSTNATVMQDAQGEAAGYLDPFAPKGKQGPRYEKVAGLGPDAVAFVESKDPQRGIVGDGAFLLMRKGPHVVVLVAYPLPGRDRAATLALLEQVGRIAAKRLD